MKLRGAYSVDPELMEPIRHIFLKGVGAFVVALVLISVAAGLLGARTGEKSAFFLDAIGVLVLLAIAQTYSKAVATERLKAAREMARKKKPDQVLALLLPFARGGLFNTRSRFDKTGEAHYMLARAAASLGEKDVLEYCQFFLAKVRGGKWATKALRLKLGAAPEED